VVMSMLAPSRRWPSTPGHGVEFKDFELRQAQLFKGLAAHYGPALVPALLPPLFDLMKNSARDAQAVATEALAGLVRGAGHWPLSEQQRLWDAVCPALRTALRACSVQSLGDWQACLRYIAFNRDPRRIAWLATMLVEEAEQRAAEALALETTDVAMCDDTISESGKASGDGGETAVMVTTGAGDTGGTAQTSLLQANCLRFLAPLVVELGWRGLPLLRRLLRGELMRAWVTHPYRQVREEVGSLLAMAMDACTPSPSQSAHLGDAIRSEVTSFVQHLVGACQVPIALTAMIETVTVGATTGEGSGNELALEPTDEKERAKARAARETALRCISHTCNAARAFCVSEHAATLLPVVMTAAASVQPPDLSNAAKACAALVAHLPLLPSQYGGLLQLMQTLVTAGSWRLRGGLLPVSALLAYRGQFTEPVEEHATALRQMLHVLMCDTQLEVREASAVVLAGFIRLRGPSERKITLKWARQRAKRGQPAAARHAGVLALVALLQLAPYDVPAWLPEVIELLASFHAEPQPIKATVSQAFADFKRTHQDNWASHRERFTPEQQDLISDMLVSPSFYA